MSKKSKAHRKEVFEPVIGFEKVQDNGESISLSDFEIEGKPPRSISFFSDLEKPKEESSPSYLENQEGLNESGGLNHAFFEENSESQSEKEISNFFQPSNDHTTLGRNLNEEVTEKENSNAQEKSESPEIINTKNNNAEKKNKEENEEKIPQPKNKSSLVCCKCKSCVIF